MRNNAYEVVFTDGRSMEMWAFSAEQAKILAQAECINRGENYDVKECNYVGPEAPNVKFSEDGKRSLADSAGTQG